MKKKMLTLFVLLATTIGSVQAQQTSDGAEDRKDMFRFYRGSDMFIFPGKDNEAIFRQACNYIDSHRELIVNGRMQIQVFGYCGTNGTSTKRLGRAKTMSNRVKSEFIHAKKAVESNFITHNSSDAYSEKVPNAVVMKFILKDEHEVMTGQQETKKADAILTESRQTDNKQADAKQAENKQQTAEKQGNNPVIAQEVAPKDEIATNNSPVCPANPYKFALRTNLLHWLAATPNVGIEWRPTSVFSLVLDADYAPWRWNDKLNYYRIWNIQPQVRFHMFPTRRLYVGGEFHAGALNWKVNTKGTQGDFIGGGLTLGYQLPLNRSLDLDFNLGAGYTSYKYDKYKDVDGFLFPYEQGLKKNYWGITSAGVTLVWKICK